jgi:hypothetical protein
MKKLLTLLFASFVVFSLTMPAFAQEGPKPTKSPKTKQKKTKTKQTKTPKTKS